MVFELPAGAVAPRGFDLDELRFPLKSVGSFAKLRYGRALQEGKRRAGTVPVYGTNGQCGTHDTALASPPGVILGRKGQGHLGVKWCDVPFWVIDTAYYADLDKSIVDPKWFYYITDFVGLDELKTGEKPGLARELFERQLFPTPPLSEQKAIAAILGALDDKIDLNRQMNRTLEEMASALFKSWFIDFDPVTAKLEGRQPFGMDAATAGLFPAEFEETAEGVVPRGWKTGRIADLADLNPEAWKLGNMPEVVRYLDLASVKWGSAEPASEMSRTAAPSRARRILRADDTLIATVRPGNGSFALIVRNEPALTGSTGFAVLRPRSSKAAHFVYLSTTRRESIEYFAAVAEGSASAYPDMPPETVSGLGIVRPSDKVLATFDQVVRPWFELKCQNDAESKTLGNLRDLLLPQLLSGEIRIRDAEKLVEGAL